MLLLTALPRKDALADFDYVTSVDAVTFSASLMPPPFSSSLIVTLLIQQLARSEAMTRG